MFKLNEVGIRDEKQKQKLREKYKPEFDVKLKRDDILYILENIDTLMYEVYEPAKSELTNGVQALGETFTTGDLFQLLLDSEEIYNNERDNEEMNLGIHAILLALDLNILYGKYRKCYQEDHFEWLNKRGLW